MLFLLLFPRFSRRVSIIKCLTKFSTVCNHFPPHQRKTIKRVLVFVLFWHALYETTIPNILQVCSFKDTDIRLFYIYIYKYFALKKKKKILRGLQFKRYRPKNDNKNMYPSKQWLFQTFSSDRLRQMPLWLSLTIACQTRETIGVWVFRMGGENSWVVSFPVLALLHS